MLRLLCLNGTDVTLQCRDPPDAPPLPQGKFDFTEMPEGYKPMIGKLLRRKKRERVEAFIVRHEPSIRLVVTICGVIAAAVMPLILVFTAA